MIIEYRTASLPSIANPELLIPRVTQQKAGQAWSARATGQCPLSGVKQTSELAGRMRETRIIGAGQAGFPGARVSSWTRTGGGANDLTKTVDMSFDDAVMSTKEALKRHNFRVLTEIDMKDNFKKGLYPQPVS